MGMMRYDDLLALRYEAGSHAPENGALDCYGATAEIVARAHGEAARDRFLGLLKKPTHNWIRVEGPARLGDVVLSLAGDGLHVSGVAATSPTLVVSAATGYGVYAQRLSTVKDVQGIYRDPETQCL